MSPALPIYLQNHEAAARAGIDLCRRAARNQREQPQGPVLNDLCAEIEGDRDRLRMIMELVHVQANPVLGALLQVGERVGRLKPNGHVLRRAPLSDLIEIEALVDAVSAKRAGWYGLSAAQLDASVTTRVAELLTRADEQLGRLRTIHATVAARVLG
ncbi:MAG TPA: hypothetical protein VIT41_09230 [Microlunatus sp.]